MIVGLNYKFALICRVFDLIIYYATIVLIGNSRNKYMDFKLLIDKINRINFFLISNIKNKIYNYEFIRKICINRSSHW